MTVSASPHPQIPDARHLRIAGKTRAARAAYDVVNPTSEEVFTQAPEWTPLEVDEAVLAGEQAQRAWAALPPRSRAAHVRELAALLREHTDELAALDALDGGFPIRTMRGDVNAAAEYLEVMADLALELGGRTIPVTGQHLHYTVHQPYGVVGRIVPYNHPLFFSATKVAAPLVAGNAVLLKAPAQTPVSAMRFAELADEVLPPGLCTIVTGGSPESARSIVRHPRIRRIGFIGSEATGRAIQHDAADTGVKYVTLELGGKNALIIRPDADPREAAASAVKGMNFDWTMGQSCGSTSRLLVHQDLAEDVLGHVVDALPRLQIGDPLDESTDVGPQVSATHYERVLAAIDRGRAEGAEVAAGGGRPTEVGAEGYFVAPTVLTGVRPDSWVAQNEIFGPVLAVTTFRDDEEAVRIANSVPYGLTAGVWTNDVRVAHRMVAELQAGYTWINGSSNHFWGLPFGGVKASGIGREESSDELLSYTETKTVNVLLGS